LGRRQPLPAIPGQPPAPGALPVGCAFVPRCAEAFTPCQAERPELYDLGGGRRARCFLHRPEIPVDTAP
jgi:oligopeptide/dipeptide ABC transporter ATP-binding protein